MARRVGTSSGRPLEHKNMALPINPPAWFYQLANNMEFKDGIASHLGFWFWTYEGRTWAVGPYRTRRSASRDREGYMKMTDGPALRVWVPTPVHMERKPKSI